MKLRFLSLALFASLPLVGGTIVPVTNGSFENSGPGYGSPANWTLFTSTSSPTFVAVPQVAANSGSPFPVVSGAGGTQFVAVDLDHNNLGDGNPTPVIPAGGSLGGLVSDTLGVFQASTTYLLSVNLGFNNPQDALNVGFALGTGAPALADISDFSQNFVSATFNGSQFTPDALETATLTLDTDTYPALVGQPINVSLFGVSNFEYGREVLFDGVSLVESSDSEINPSLPDAPEPAGWVLLCAGMLAVLGSRFGLQSARAKAYSRFPR